ncbi:MAG: NmrA family NAD(P)-binding protein [Chloroflexales bacterium]|nr:NmrA family NAD(P)-binding protein [Chloroflexales bacterium]
MLVLIVGATGRVGSAVVRHLLAFGVQVRVLVRSNENRWIQTMRSQGVELAPGDVMWPASLPSVCAGVDVVVSAFTRPGQVAEIEGVGNTNLLKAAHAAGVSQYLYVSAVGADRADNVPDLSTKGQVELLIRNSGLHFTIVRATIFHEMLRMAMCRNVAFIPGAQPRPFAWIAASDVGRVLALCCGRQDAFDDLIEVGGPELLTFDESYAAFSRGQAQSVRTVHIPLGLLRLGSLFNATLSELSGLMAFLEIHGAPADTTLIERRFGFRPCSVEGWARSLTSRLV